MTIKQQQTSPSCSCIEWLSTLSVMLHVQGWEFSAHCCTGCTVAWKGVLLWSADALRTTPCACPPIMYQSMA